MDGLVDKCWMSGQMAKWFVGLTAGWRQSGWMNRRLDRWHVGSSLHNFKKYIYNVPLNEPKTILKLNGM